MRSTRTAGRIEGRKSQFHAVYIFVEVRTWCVYVSEYKRERTARESGSTGREKATGEGERNFDTDMDTYFVETPAMTEALVDRHKGSCINLDFQLQLPTSKYLSMHQQ